MSLSLRDPKVFSSKFLLAAFGIAFGISPRVYAANACDINGDGAVNVSDVQLEANQALQVSSCANDLSQDGQCNVQDVQIVVNAVLSGACSAASTGSTPPAQAAAAGFTHLVFSDHFASISTISPDGNGNTNWYANSPNSPTVPPSAYSVANGVLTLKSDTSGYGSDLATATAAHPAKAWQHGYFEASMQFDPSGYQDAQGGWPAFWTWSMEAVLGTIPAASNGHSPELDIMEAWPHQKDNPPGTGVTIITTLHEWHGSTNDGNSNNTPTLPAGTDLSKYHTYGVLWTTNKVVWYFDDKPVTTLVTGPGTLWPSLEQQHLYLILGTGHNWPVNFKFVNVWQ
jgi:beta-glucanase (GH16 family)